MKHIIISLLSIIITFAGLNPVCSEIDAAFVTSGTNYNKKTYELMENSSADWGGYLKIRGHASWPSQNSFYDAVDSGTYLDGSIESRIKSVLFFSDFAEFETHYEMIFSGGDTRDKSKKLQRLFTDPAAKNFIRIQTPEDDRRLFDLTSDISDRNNRILYHRIDRLALTLKPEWGVVRIGRQAVTWGNGFLFNPMDLFNPFSPTDIEREYKLGDDMLSLQAPIYASGNMHILYVPRRNPQTSKASWNQSSLAAKYHLFRGTTEFDLMAGRHYKDYVLGIGSVGYFGDTAWRIDATRTLLDPDASSSDYFSLVANIDYSWVWFKKNFYGFIEFYYSGIGEKDYEKAFENPLILERIDRGELYALGRTYIGGNLRAELHPLVNIFLTAITNTRDPSGVLQPRATYDISQDIQILIGSNIFWGCKGSEFGGFKVPGTDFTTGAADTAFIWVSYYF